MLVVFYDIFFCKYLILYRLKRLNLILMIVMSCCISYYEVYMLYFKLLSKYHTITNLKEADLSTGN